MAAAEYFSNASMQQGAQNLYSGPTSHPQAPTSSPYLHHPAPQQPQSQQAPPPYAEHSVHFAPTPAEIPQRHSFSHQQRPPQSTWNRPSPQQTYSSHLAPHQPSPFQSAGSSPGAYGSPQQRPQYLSPHIRPYAQPNASQYSLANGGYASDPEPQRRRHNHRRSRRDSGSKRSVKETSRSKNTDAFLGAAGGGLIGDLIFPGLGTVGGAALGWLGGKDYAKQRKGREDRRADEQRGWEKKHRPDDYRDRRRGSSEHR